MALHCYCFIAEHSFFTARLIPTIHGSYEFYGNSLYIVWNLKLRRTTLINLLKVFVIIRLLWVCTIPDHHGECKLYAFLLNVQQLSVRAMNPWHFENLHNISASIRPLNCQYLLWMCIAVRTNKEDAQACMYRLPWDRIRIPHIPKRRRSSWNS